MINVTAKIELSPQTVFFLSKEVIIKTKSATIAFFFSLLLLSFSSPFLFSLSSFFSRRIFWLILPSLLVFFPVKRLQFSFGTFSKIRQDNALTFTVTHILQIPILQLSLTYRHPQIYVSIFEAFRFLFVKFELERRGG